MYFVIAAICILIYAYKAKFVGLHSFNEDYLSIANTTAIKGFCAIVIVSSHTLSVLKINVYPNIAYHAVAVFFFLSGYGLMYGYLHKPDYLKSFLSRRFTAVLIPFMTAVLIYIPIRLHLDLMPKTFLSTLSGKFLFVAYSWYVYAIAFFYISFYVIMKLFRKKVAVITVMFILLMISYILLLKFFNYGLYWYIAYIPFFAGLLWAYQKERIDKFIKNHYILSFALTVALCLGTFVMLMGTEKKFGFNIGTEAHNIRNLSIVFFILMILAKFNIGNKFTSFVGKVSYEMYLMQGACIMLVNQIFKVKNGILLYILVIALTFPAAYAMNKLNSLLIRLITGRVARNGKKAINE